MLREGLEKLRPLLIKRLNKGGGEKMDYPITITSEKFTVFWRIKANGLVDMSDPKVVVKEARVGWGVAISKEECIYIQKHFKKLEREFKVRKEI